MSGLPQEPTCRVPTRCARSVVDVSQQRLPYSITSSAIARTVGERLSPSALAVLELMPCARPPSARPPFPRANRESPAAASAPPRFRRHYLSGLRKYFDRGGLRSAPIDRARCRSRVKSRYDGQCGRCPLHPPKRTFAASPLMFAWCQSATSARLFDHLVGAPKKRQRDAKSKRLGSIHVYHQLELGSLFDGKIGRLSAFQNLVDIDGRAVKLSWHIG